MGQRIRTVSTICEKTADLEASSSIRTWRDVRKYTLATRQMTTKHRGIVKSKSFWTARSKETCTSSLKISVYLVSLVQHVRTTEFLRLLRD